MTSHHKITNHLWYDREAKDAAHLYVSAFAEAFGPNGENTGIKHSSVLHNTPSGSVDIVTLELAGQEFTLISAGPIFTFTPAISFQIACTARKEVDILWKNLSKGGTVLMELGEYPFSERFGWTQDRFGLSWQVMLKGDRPIRQKVTPMLMFVGKQWGKAEEAISFYASVFRKSKVGEILRYGKDEAPDKPGTSRQAAFTLEGKHFAAMDSAHEHNFSFNEAISFMVNCDDQKEIDYYWQKLSADPSAEQCGWIKDRYGVSWQIVPRRMNEMMRDDDQDKIARVTEAFLKMKKFDLAKLEKAYIGD